MKQANQFIGRILNPQTMMYEKDGMLSYPVEMTDETKKPFGLWAFLSWKDRIEKINKEQQNG